jgi:DNA invertase Pin-like site-specific DNA recombinase
MSKTAYSYARFSTSEQLNGRSLHRQLEAAKDYCRRHNLTLSEQNFADLGVSGFKGGNARGGQLADFLDLVKEGRIARGSVLIVENVDRISRLPPDEATSLITGIVKAGVSIATTSPEQLYTPANITQLATWLPLQIAQCLAHEESAKKSDRLRDVWADKRKKLGDGHVMSERGPAWLRLSADRKNWVILEDRARMVRRAFALTLDGRGSRAVCRILIEEHPAGLAGRGWKPSAVGTLLRNRAVLGEYRPHVGTCARRGGVTSTRKPAGDAVKGYYPAIVPEADFYKAQAALDQRRTGGVGRAAGTPNLFNGLLVNALDGSRMVVKGAHGRRILVSAAAANGQPGSVFRAVDYALFERSVLARLLELKPADVLGRPTRDDDPVALWSGKLVVLNRNLATMQQKAANAEDASVFIPILEDLGRQRKEAVAQLERAKAESASREGDVLGETLSLVKLLDDAEGEERETLRRKIRAALRRLVESACLLVVARGRTRLVALQLRFAGGKRVRSYLFAAHQGTPKVPAYWSCWSLADKVKAGALDLRDKAHAEALEARLQALDLATLEEKCDG